MSNINVLILGASDAGKSTLAENLVREYPDYEVITPISRIKRFWEYVFHLEEGTCDKKELRNDIIVDPYELLDCEEEFWVEFGGSYREVDKLLTEWSRLPISTLIDFMVGCHRITQSNHPDFTASQFRPYPNCCIFDSIRSISEMKKIAQYPFDLIYITSDGETIRESDVGLTEILTVAIEQCRDYQKIHRFGDRYFKEWIY